MNRRGHLVFGFIFTIPFIISNIIAICLGGYTELWMWFMIPRYIFIWAFFSRQADSDHAMELPHRHWLYHSILLPVIFTILFWGPKGVSFTIHIWAVHLLCDIYQKPGKKPVLGYLIHYKNKALNARQTKQWLAVNGIIGVIIAFLFDFVPMVI